MGPEYYWMHGMWVFPVIMPIVMIIAFLIVSFLIFGRGGFRPPWQGRDYPCKDRQKEETALEILNKRYAKGEIAREEFEQVKKDILS